MDSLPPEAESIDVALQRKLQNFILDLREIGFVVTTDVADLDDRLLLTIIATMGKGRA
jgi:hypothetical protein